MDDSNLTTAPLPGLRPDDHLRNAGAGGRAAAGRPGATRAPPQAMYGDFTCSRCAVEALRLRAAGTPLVFRHFALKARHPRALATALAAEAAARQGAFWAFHDALFEDQGHIDDPHLWARCERIGLDVDRFELDRRDDAVAARVRRDVREALRAGLTTTPAIVALPIDSGD